MMKLNSILDIRKLAAFDIKNMDLKQWDLNKIKELALSKPDLFLNGILILATLLMSFYFVTSKKQIAKSLESQIISATEKVEAVNRLQSTQDQLKDYLDSRPQALSSDEIIGLVSNLATEHNLQITFFSPARKEEQDLYSRTSLRINLVSQDYESIGRFVYALESSDKSLKIRNWSGHIEARQQADLQNEQDQSIISGIEIESLDFKK